MLFTLCPRVSIHFVHYLRHSRGYPLILYAIYVIPAGIHSFCTLFTSFPRVSGGGRGCAFCRPCVSNPSRNSKFWNHPRNVFQAAKFEGEDDQNLPWSPKGFFWNPWVSTPGGHSREYPFISWAIYVIPAGIHSFCMLFTLFPLVSIHFVFYFTIPAGIHWFCALFT